MSGHAQSVLSLKKLYSKASLVLFIFLPHGKHMASVEQSCSNC